jgi:hypothetical protein
VSAIMGLYVKGKLEYVATEIVRDWIVNQGDSNEVERSIQCFREVVEGELKVNMHLIRL